MTSSKKNDTSKKYDPFREVLNKLNLGDKATEIIIAVMLAIATVATAWSGYQASRWGGVQSTKYSEAGALRVESVRASNEAGQLTQIDIGLFTNWINAYAEDNNELVNFYESRFRDEFNPAFDAWLLTNPETNPDSPKSPFSMSEYRVSKAIEADTLEQEAARTFNEGKDANQQSDDYILNTVFLASVLFLSGIASKINWRPARISLVVLGILMLLVGLINVIRYPIT